MPFLGWILILSEFDLTVAMSSCLNGSVQYLEIMEETVALVSVTLAWACFKYAKSIFPRNFQIVWLHFIVWSWFSEFQTVSLPLLSFSEFHLCACIQWFFNFNLVCHYHNDSICVSCKLFILSETLCYLRQVYMVEYMLDLRVVKAAVKECEVRWHKVLLVHSHRQPHHNVIWNERSITSIIL